MVSVLLSSGFPVCTRYDNESMLSKYFLHLIDKAQFKTPVKKYVAHQIGKDFKR